MPVLPCGDLQTNISSKFLRKLFLNLGKEWANLDDILRKEKKGIFMKPLDKFLSTEQNNPTVEQHLTFRVGEESFGIPVSQVKEIIRTLPITPLPQMPDYVRGIVNLRGKVIPIVDLRLRMKLGTGDMTDRTCIVVAELQSEFYNGTTVGVVVDGVEEVFFPKEVEDATSFGNTLNTDFMRGIVRIHGELKTLLDLDALVTQELITSKT